MILGRGTERSSAARVIDRGRGAFGVADEVCVGTSIAVIVPTNVVSFRAHRDRGAVIMDESSRPSHSRISTQQKPVAADLPTLQPVEKAHTEEIGAQLSRLRDQGGH